MTREKLNSLYNEFYNTKLNNAVCTNQLNVSCNLSKPITLFMDEFSRATPDLHNACLQLVLEKKLHNHILPFVNGNKTFIIAADNPDNGDYNVEILDPATKDRFVTIDVDVDVKSWLKWARNNKVNPIVMAYITSSPKKLHFIPKDTDDKGATPRSWTKLAKFVDNFDNIPKEVHYDIVTGKVGSTLALQFLDFYKNYKNIVSIEDIETLTEDLLQKTTKLENIGAGIKDLINDISVIQKTELAEGLVLKYIDGKAKDSYAMLGMLYSLEVEILVGFLKRYSSEQNDNFLKIAEFDLELNNKALFIKLAKNL